MSETFGLNGDLPTTMKSERKCLSLGHVLLCSAMDCSLPVSSVHGILQAIRVRVRVRVGSHSLLQVIFLTQGLNLSLLYWHVDSLPSGPPGKPISVFYFLEPVNVLGYMATAN